MPPTGTPAPSPSGDGHRAKSAFTVLFAELAFQDRASFFVAIWDGTVGFWIARGDGPSRPKALADRLGDAGRAGTRRRRPYDPRVADGARRVAETLATMEPPVAAAFEIHVLSALSAAWGGHALAAALHDQAADMSRVVPVAVPDLRTDVVDGNDLTSRAPPPSPSVGPHALAPRAIEVVVGRVVDPDGAEAVSAVLTDGDGLTSWMDVVHVVDAEGGARGPGGGLLAVLDRMDEGATLVPVVDDGAGDDGVIADIVARHRPDLVVAASDGDDGSDHKGTLASCRSSLERRRWAPSTSSAPGPENAVIG